MSRASNASVRSAAALWLLVGCAAPPPDSERVDESIVITKYAPGVDFGAYRTYFLKPQILSYNDDGDPEPIDEETAETLLEQTRKHLDDRGYEETDLTGEADLGVQVLYTDKITTTYWCYYWWDPYYWGYPGWGYYPYYGGCDYSAWKSNMLGTFMVDLRAAREENPDLGQGGEGGAGAQDLLPGIWFSGVYGVSLSAKEARDGIDQAFKQSPYLRAD